MLSDWMNTIIFCTSMVCISNIICVCTICGTLENIKKPKGKRLNGKIILRNRKESD